MHMLLEIQVLDWDRHKNEVELNRFICKGEYPIVNTEV